MLLKQGARTRHNWHERYFVVQANNMLTYYNNKGDSTPKGTYSIDQLADLEISEIFVEKRHKELVYCITITWAEDATDTAADSSNLMEDSSTLGGSVGDRNDITEVRPLSPAQSVQTERSELPPYPGPSRVKLTPLKKFRRITSEGSKRTPLRHRANSAGEASFSVRGVPTRSVDAESLTLGSRMRRKRRNSKRLPPSEVVLENQPEIPTLVEVDQRHALPLLAPRMDTNLDDEDSHPTARATNKTPARTPYQVQQVEEQEMLRSKYLSTKKENKKKKREKFAEGSKIFVATGAAVGVAVFTAGIGLIAGLAVLGVGAAAGGGGAVAGVWRKKREGEITIGSTDYETAKLWKSTLEACFDADSVKKSTWGQLFVTDGRKTRAVLLPHDPKVFVFSSAANWTGQEKRDRTVLFENNSKWSPLEGGWASFLGTGVQGLRIFREERIDRANVTTLSIEGRPCLPVKAHVVLGTSPLDAFLCLMSYARIDPAPTATLTPNSGQRASIQLIATIDDHTDVIRLVSRPLYLFPSWTTPRDFVLYRYWRFEQDGTYVVCYESVDHKGCPPHPDFVRGAMHQVFTIAPQKKSRRRGCVKPSYHPECLMTAVVQVDPKGWVPNLGISLLSDQGYGDAFGVAALLQLLDIRDAIDLDRFVSVSTNDNLQEGAQTAAYGTMEGSPPAIARIRSLDSQEEIHDDPINYDFAYAGRESMHLRGAELGIANRPESLDRTKWAEPDSNSFRVRGHNYKEDKQKLNAGPSIGRLVAVDLVWVDSPLYSGFSTHPTERVQTALRREAKLLEKGLKSDLSPFIFVVNLILPGPPVYHGVFYFAVDDLGTIDGTDGTPSSHLCNEFFFGDSDEFRDRTFKLIPQIVQGNFIVRKAVGSTPAIMGKKLRQEYVRTDRFFEVVLDCGSSSVATGVIRLSLGYAKTLVVDMGFLFEGDDDSTLPERLFGCVRMKQIDFSPSRLRKVEPPLEVEA